MNMEPSKISGWILPDGHFESVEEWWHLNYLYELSETGSQLFSDVTSREILQSGDESAIRHLAAERALVKISRGEIDGYSMSDCQLRTLQSLLELSNPDFEFRIIGRDPSSRDLRKVSVARILKLRSASSLFG